MSGRESARAKYQEWLRGTTGLLSGLDGTVAKSEAGWLLYLTGYLQAELDTDQTPAQQPGGQRDEIPEHLKPAWWDAYVGYAASLECGPDGFDAEIHRDGFAAGWTLGQEADHGAARRMAALEAALEAARIPHLRVEGDPWFSCPEAWREDNADDDWSGTCIQCDGKPCNHRCNCGADKHNAAIAVALASAATSSADGDGEPEYVASPSEIAEQQAAYWEEIRAVRQAQLDNAIDIGRVSDAP